MRGKARQLAFLHTTSMVLHFCFDPIVPNHRLELTMSPLDGLLKWLWFVLMDLYLGVLITLLNFLQRKLLAESYLSCGLNEGHILR